MGCEGRETAGGKPGAGHSPMAFGFLNLIFVLHVSGFIGGTVTHTL